MLVVLLLLLLLTLLLLLLLSGQKRGERKNVSLSLSFFRSLRPHS